MSCTSTIIKNKKKAVRHLFASSSVLQGKRIAVLR